MMILELFLSYICLLPISRRKFVVFWKVSFLKKEMKRKFHNMLCLTLNPRFNNFHLASSFVGHKDGVNIVEEYDR